MSEAYFDGLNERLLAAMPRAAGGRDHVTTAAPSFHRSAELSVSKDAERTGIDPLCGTLRSRPQ